jgi:uncharacterized repeat protein (TIGR03803 family)
MNWAKIGICVLAISVLLATAAAASTTHITYSFNGDDDGEYADTDLVLDSAGNIFGTTVQGGDFASGTVWELTAAGQHLVLYSFTGGLDGGEPYKGVTLDAQGNLYGTAVTGGRGGCEGGCGVVYKLTHTASGWRQNVVYYFSGGNDGSGPGSGVTIDSSGNVFGMTPTGGANGLGVVFQLSPSPTGLPRFKVIHTFTGGADGASASAGRLVIRSGKLYGVATTGGNFGSGVAFELTPTLSGEWSVKTLYSFRGQPDAGFPYGGVLFDARGNLYGTTYYDGANDLGAVYELIPTPSGEWGERVLYSFRGGTDGAGSIGNLVFDRLGNLYGTTSEGGAGCSCGVIFKLTPAGVAGWVETVAYRFQGAPDGGFVYNGMAGDGTGNFYGATVHGGLTNDGTVYKFTP